MTTSINKQAQYKKAATIPDATQQKKTKASVDDNSEVGCSSHSSSLTGILSPGPADLPPNRSRLLLLVSIAGRRNRTP